MSMPKAEGSGKGAVEGGTGTFLDSQAPRRGPTGSITAVQCQAKAAAETAVAETAVARANLEQAEKPGALKRMIEDMKAAASEGNNFYNFGNFAAMRAALNNLPLATVQAIEVFAKKLAYRRTPQSFPILVRTGTGYLLTESAPSSEDVNITAAQAKELVAGWGYSSPDRAQWKFLNRLGLVDERFDKKTYNGTCGEWLPSEEHTTDDPNLAWAALSYNMDAHQRHVRCIDEDCGVRALQVLSKA